MEIIDMTHSLDRSGLAKNRPECIVVHSTHSYLEFDDLLASHRKRGFAGVGYHFFVSASNKIYQARPTELEGAHAQSFNKKSIGVCVYSKEEGVWDKGAIPIAKSVIKSIKDEIGDVDVIPHTAAQLAYLNELLEKDGMPRRFEADPKITEPARFNELNQNLQRFLYENLACGNDVRKLIMGFKNCPGPMFKEIV